MTAILSMSPVLALTVHSIVFAIMLVQSLQTMDVYGTTLMNAHMKPTCVIYQSKLLAQTRREATTVLVKMVTKKMVKLVSMLINVIIHSLL